MDDVFDTYEKLLTLGCFSLNEATSVLGNENTTKSTLLLLKKKGYIQSIKRNLYVIISLETHEPVSTPFEIASHITGSAYVSHHSAFEYYGLTNQVYTDVYVSSDERFNPFEFGGRTYRYISSKCEKGIVSSRKLRVTDIERTLIDSIKDFSKIGGLEELKNCISMITVINEEKVLDYLEDYNNGFLYKKTGYLIMNSDISGKFSKRFYDLCREKGQNSVRYLYEELKNEESSYEKEWKLFVPAGNNTEDDIDV